MYSLTESEILRAIAVLMEYALAYRSSTALDMRELLVDDEVAAFFEDVEERFDRPFLHVVREYRASGPYFAALDHACEMFEEAKKAYYEHFLGSEAGDLF